MDSPSSDLSADLASELISSPPFEELVYLEPLDPPRESRAFFARLFKESLSPELVPDEVLPPLLLLPPPRDSRAFLARLVVPLPSDGVVLILDAVWMEAWGPEPPTLE